MNGKSGEDIKVLLSHISDLKERAYSRGVITVSDFLTEEEQAETLRLGKTFFFGGYDGAERKTAVFLPDYLTEDDVKDDPGLAGICYTVISLSDYDSEGKITHRDVLGALMNLGIKRETVGDIVTFGNYAVAVTKAKIGDFIASELKKVGRYTVSVRTEEKYDLRPVDDSVTVKKSVASMRLDGVISALFNLSRTDAASAVTNGLSAINGITAVKAEKQVGTGDRISLRGKGRAEIISCDGRSAKGRIKIEAKIYK
ncbi:MAG: hypothetical protein KBT31_03210 [Firmicutes bacterium]|nr:hypothetical protein [Candidatus Colimorpha enterica]